MVFFRLPAAALLLAVVAAGSARADRTDDAWRAYVTKFVQDDGRVIDFAVAPGITTSEGQAYALLRAVWVDDRPVFERVLAWTTRNLARDGSPLPAWKWGADAGGQWGVLDANTASDADVILAFALDVAARRWNAPEYGARAREIAAAVWSEEVERIGDRWYLLPGRWARGYDPRPLNPSYYSPALLRRLAAIDPEHPWAEVAATTYHLLSVRLPTTGLPPDWISVATRDGALAPGAIGGQLSGRFGHDAYRVYWNLAIDYTWDRTPEAKLYLEEQTWLARFLVRNGTLPREVAPDALPTLGGPEPLALHGSLYPALRLFHPEAAAKSAAQLDATWHDGIWGERADYYAQNLAWFGTALAEGRFPPR